MIRAGRIALTILVSHVTLTHAVTDLSLKVALESLSRPWKRTVLSRSFNTLRVDDSLLPRRSRGSVLTLQEPTDKVLEGWFGPSAAINHSKGGQTKPILADKNELKDKRDSGVLWWPSVPGNFDGWRRRCYRSRVGRGKQCYQRVQKAALDWTFSDVMGQNAIRCVGSSRSWESMRTKWRGWLSLSKATMWHKPGHRLLCTIRRNGPLKVISPVNVVYEVVDKRGSNGAMYTSTAYATREGHLLRGEERVSVIFRLLGDVDVEILSFSKPAASLGGRFVWPFIGFMQDAFFRHQMKWFERVAGEIQ